MSILYNQKENYSKNSKSSRKTSSLLLILLNKTTSKIQGSERNDVRVLYSFQYNLEKVILLQFFYSSAENYSGL